MVAEVQELVLLESDQPVLFRPLQGQLPARPRPMFVNSSALFSTPTGFIPTIVFSDLHKL